MNPKRILIIEDDTDAASVLEAYLKRDNFQVLLARDGISGLEMALRLHPDLVLLDVMLPGMNGTEVLSALRRKNDIPVIMLTAMGDEADKIGALRYGADDYVTKPYHPGEVVARVQAVLRRSSGAMSTGRTLSFGALVVDQDAMIAAVTDAQGQRQTLDLTPTELSLLTTLLGAQTRAFSRQELLEASLPDSDALERVVDTHIYNLRKKLEAVGIRGVLLTVRAVGYRFRQP
ncbi:MULTISPECIES: response regulator transcription factor [Dickeya]|uniref:Two-component response regulator n=1 Tax=Dickeya aquatica TaxID=1401087 RepID=A0A375A7S5_9GAMM|nr:MULTISPECIES: response regulator transcription factor [Dickeya]SLM61966.1 Two-component response regulator [Dickeya aquatica]